MADRYVVLPGWMVRQQEGYASPEEAAVAASTLVSHDRVPRSVVRVCSEVSALSAPVINVVQIAEVR